MAFLGSTNAYVGLDIGTSSLKVVELISRRNRLEVTTYAQANLANLLIHSSDNSDDAIRHVANIVGALLDSAGVASDAVVAALPSSAVFSTVLALPDIVDDEDMNQAIHFAARDVVPADLNEMILGWSRVGELPHMDNKQSTNRMKQQAKQAASDGGQIPIFVTAAPKDIIERYTKVMELVQLELVALEVETFPLVRSLLANQQDSAMIVDIGDQVTTFHIIDKGTPRVSHSVDYGGQDITQAIVEQLKLSYQEAEQQKAKFGLTNDGPEQLHLAISNATEKLMKQGERLLGLFTDQAGHSISKTILIGGGAKLKNLDQAWSDFSKHKVAVGNPWKGLAYPKELENRLHELGPTFAVAIGLAQRGFSHDKT